jgi:hypothetical protein
MCREISNFSRFIEGLRPGREKPAERVAMVERAC